MECVKIDEKIYFPLIIKVCNNTDKEKIMPLIKAIDFEDNYFYEFPNSSYKEFLAFLKKSNVKISCFHLDMININGKYIKASAKSVSLKEKGNWSEITGNRNSLCFEFDNPAEFTDNLMVDINIPPQSCARFSFYLPSNFKI